MRRGALTANRCHPALPLGIVLALLAGVAATLGWVVPAAVVAALMVVVLWRNPVLAIAVTWATGLSYGLLLRLVEGNSAMLLWKDALILLLVMRTVASPSARRRASEFPWIPLLGWFLVAVASALASSLPPAQLVDGLRFTFEWPLMAIAGAAWLNLAQLRRVLVWMVPFLALNAALAVWQSTSSVDELLSAGYQYFDNVREAGGVVRAFGAMTYGIPFAHTMAVLSLVFAALLSNARRGRDRILALSGGACSVAGVVLAVNRTSLAGICVAALVTVAVVTSRLHVERLKRYARAYRLPLIVCVTGAVVLLGLRGGQLVVQPLTGSDDSITARVQQWSSLPLGSDLLLGGGPGAVGVAAEQGELRDSIRDHAVQDWVVDNYYLSVVAQYGVTGLGFMLVLLAALWRRLRAKLSEDATWPVMAAIACLAYLAVAMLTLNVWEDYPTPVYAWTVIGAALGMTAKRQTAEDVGALEDEPVPERTLALT